MRYLVEGLVVRVLTAGSVSMVCLLECESQISASRMVTDAVDGRFDSTWSSVIDALLDVFLHGVLFQAHVVRNQEACSKGYHSRNYQPVLAIQEIERRHRKGNPSGDGH